MVDAYVEKRLSLLVGLICLDRQIIAAKKEQGDSGLSSWCISCLPVIAKGNG